MPASRPRIRALAVGTGAFALVAVAAGGTFAASNPATLYACYDVYGNVRMGDVAQCKLPGGGRLVTWSTGGAPGPTGATGATGPTGQTGPIGPTGASILATAGVVRDQATLPPGINILGGFGQGSTGCPVGKQAIGGWTGVNSTSPADVGKVVQAFGGPDVPTGALPTVWWVEWQVAGGGAYTTVGTMTFSVYVVCAG
jgi:hypothetical protein